MKLFSRFLATVAILSLAVSWTAPSILSALANKSLQRAHLGTGKIEIKQISPWLCRGSLIWRGKAGSMQLQQFELHYNPRSLLNRKIKRVNLQGLRLNPDPAFATAYFNKKDTKTTELSLSLPLTIESLDIMHSQIVYPLKNQAFNLPLQLSATAQYHNQTLQQLKGTLKIDGFDLQLDLEKIAAGYTIKADGEIDNKSWRPWLPSPYQDGRLNLHAHLQLGQNHNSGSVQIQGQELHLPPPLHGDKPRLTLEIKDQDVSYQLTQLSSPFGEKLAITGDFSLDSKQGRGLMENGDARYHYHFKTNQHSWKLALENRFPQTFGAITLSPWQALIKQEKETSLEFHAKEVSQSGVSLKKIIVQQQLTGKKLTGKLQAKLYLLQQQLGQITAHNSGTATSGQALLKLASAELPIQLFLNYQNPTSAAARYQLQLPKTTISIPENSTLASLIPKKSSGELTIKGSAEYAGKHKNRASLSISDGFWQQGQELYIRGIKGTLNLQQLLPLRSLRGQQLQASSLQAGKIELKQVSVDYHLLEGLPFIERSNFQWCGGSVSSDSIAQSGGKYHSNLYCDRLLFSQLMEQLDVGKSSGDATLSGRIPITWQDGQLSLENGYLYTSPGDSGTIRFSQTALIAGAMGASAQQSYLNYALDAIKDFHYSWIKLALFSKDNQLTTAIKLYGKPSIPLPYNYKNGRVQPAADGTLQQPIRLDLNFHLPITELIRYGGNIKSLME